MMNGSRSSRQAARISRRISTREWRRQPVYPILFVLCLLISMSAYLTLDSLQVGVDSYVERNQKQLVGGDLVLRSRRPFSDDIQALVDQLPPEDVVRDVQFSGIASTETQSALVAVKSISSAYPLYGTLRFDQIATSEWPAGSVIVEPSLLARLDARRGDTLQLGDATLVIADTLAEEPDRPLAGFGFGSRVLLHADDLPATGLLSQRSRVYFRIEMRIEDREQRDLSQQRLLSVIGNDRIDLLTAETADTTVSAISADFLRFLKLLVIAVILLSGIGMMSVVSAFLQRQTSTIAIRRAMGESTSRIIAGYRQLLTASTLLAIALSCAMSLLLIHVGLDLFAAVLPEGVAFGIEALSVLKTVLIALAVTHLMTWWTLEKLHDIKPLAVLHQHSVSSSRGRSRLAWVGVAVLLFSGLIWIELDDLVQTLQLMLGLGLVWFVLYGLVRLILWLIRRMKPSEWHARLALQNIYRKNNQSGLFLTTISLTVMVMGSMTLMDHSIQSQLITQYPDDAPNLFLLDIQKEQKAEIEALIRVQQDIPVTYYPVIRARIDAVNDIDTDTLREQLGTYENINRVFNLSVAERIADGEFFIETTTADDLFTDMSLDDGLVPVSILASFAEFLEVGLGDQVRFDIQGVMMTAQITSIRKRESRGPRPFFYFLFQPADLAAAPQLNFAAMRLDSQGREAIQLSLARAYPGVTTIDAGLIAGRIKAYVDQIRQLIQIFTGLSLIAGLLIFLASLVSTSQDRQRESHYYRLMGMQTRDLRRISMIEFLTLGGLALLIGIGLAVAISATVVSVWFNLEVSIPWTVLWSFMGVFLLIMLIISTLYTRSVLLARPMAFIRNEA